MVQGQKMTKIPKKGVAVQMRRTGIGWNPATGKVETLSVGGEFPKVGDQDLSKK